MTLDQLHPGESGQIHELRCASPALLRQCIALGLTAGTVVQVLRGSRGTGPMQIKCAGTLYAIRKDEAAQICVESVV